MSLHDAFDQHIPFSISPEVIHSIISQEIAQYVKNNSTDKTIESLFTNTPGIKQHISVSIDHFVYGEENNWLEGVIKFRNKLIEKIPSDILEYMLPKLSTGTLETEVAHLVSFMDAASNYYSYGMTTCCGIPKFQIEGTAEDWEKVLNSADKLSGLLPGLKEYFDNLRPVLREIRNTVDGNKIDEDWWSSIYKINTGSGGPFSNGWFNAFYAHLYDIDHETNKSIAYLKNKEHRYLNDSKRFGGLKLNNFPSNLSCVPFTWNYYGNEIPMSFVSGVLSVEFVDGFLKPRLGVSIVENNK